MDWDVDPFDQRLPVAALELSTTLPPGQKVNEPEAEMVGVAGPAVTVTCVFTDEAEQVPLLAVTLYVPVAETVMLGVVAPVDHR